MESFGEKLKALRGDLSQDGLALATGTTKASISKYENNLREPRMGTAKKFADYFGVDFNWLIGYSEVAEETTPYNVTPRGRTVQIPLLGKIPAGVAIEATEIIEGYIDTPESQIKEGQYFYLKVQGDSMIGSRIFEGDLVLVKKQSDVESGEIAVVRTNSHDATLKRVKKINGQYFLLPDNPKYEPIIISEEGAEIVGKVIKVEFDPNKKYKG